ncbi:peptidoglycan-binding protein [Streptomyces capparidis]
MTAAHRTGGAVTGAAGQRPDGAGEEGARPDGRDRPDTAGPAAAPGRARGRRGLRTSLAVLATLLVAGAAGVAATGVLGGDGGAAADAGRIGPARTVPVERTTLTRGETVAGTLGYGAPTALLAPSAGAAAGAGQDRQAPAPGGVLTRLPAAGAEIERGEPVYRVDEEKVPLLYGAAPLYRTLEAGVSGGDVEMLEENLAALGHTGFTVDDSFTSATADAVRAWQEDLGREETGRVEPDQAVVAPGARRVAEVKAVPGAAPGGELLTWTGVEPVVTVDLPTRYEHLVDKGGKATVELPDGTTAQAVVSEVGSAVTAAPKDGAGGAGETTIPVELTAKDGKGLGRYQAAPVEVTLTAERREDVLAVPVNALVARRGGGYAVQAVTEGGVEYRPVEVGVFADGMVEVSGGGVTEGLRVGVPR